MKIRRLDSSGEASALAEAILAAAVCEGTNVALAAAEDVCSTRET